MFAVSMIGIRTRQSDIGSRSRRHGLEQLVFQSCRELFRFADRQVFFDGDGNVRRAACDRSTAPATLLRLACRIGRLARIIS
ncbi:hypothetical protein EOA85_13465 [Mesorhizobium sp. M5C.F.Ca.IN.020.29.1.1]|uniref:hypothetical protein n=1 Tax=unclassified Mesorhizobium TaxID=325217 RepID=UPI000FCACBDF|nr:MULTISPECIES: hypothetical protein [unclassified Mesorhizobium]RUV58578.1 hypothetical protein EOA85_13465 [Mesorhizobium sp. M5C.F.Ca.IN.020.29.1.1]TIM82748.1 MAG: hypothetical protein E5Y50_28060 [Mesorhizobium sp.]